jgi:PAS domain S-box-containing protein
MKLILLNGGLLILLLLIIFYNFGKQEDEFLRLQAFREARSHFREINLVRQWARKHRGIYVPKTPTRKINPFLAEIPGLKTSIKDSSGQEYILHTQSTLTRELSEMARLVNAPSFGLISANPINPANLPTEEEMKALERLQEGDFDTFWETTVGGDLFFHYLASLRAERECLPCHQGKGYKLGDLMGGISMTMPLGANLYVARHNRQGFYFLSILAVAFVMGTIMVSTRQMVSKPLGSLVGMAERIAEGDFKVRVPIRTGDEVEVLGEAMDVMQEQLKISYETLEAKVEDRTRELNEAKQYLEGLIQSSTDAIIATDARGNIQFFNHGAEQMLGFSAKEITGSYVTELYESEDKAKDIMHAMRSGGGRVSAHETTLKAKDGTLIPVMISATILYDELGREVGTVGFNKDLRERKESETEIRRLESLATIGRLAKDVVKEMDQPLYDMMDRLEAEMEQEGLSPEERSTLEGLMEKADHMHRFVDVFRTFAHPVSEAKEAIDLVELVEGVLESRRAALAEGSIEVTMPLPSIRPMVRGDRESLANCIVNLANNAAEAMAQGGRLSINVDRATGLPQRAAEVVITDTGEGMTPEELERCREPFFTSKEETLEMGLGLFYVEYVIKRHGGSLEIESSPGQGTRVRLVLPKVV